MCWCSGLLMEVQRARVGFERNFFRPRGLRAAANRRGLVTHRRHFGVIASSKDLSVSFWFSPGAQIESVERDAKQIGGNKSELRGAKTDDANDGAVDGCENPTLPVALA